MNRDYAIVIRFLREDSSQQYWFLEHPDFPRILLTEDDILAIFSQTEFISRGKTADKLCSWPIQTGVKICPCCYSTFVEAICDDDNRFLCHECSVSFTLDNGGMFDDYDHNSIETDRKRQEWADEVSREWVLKQATRDLLLEVVANLRPFEILKIRLVIPLLGLIKLIESKYLTEDSVGTGVDRFLTTARIICWSFVLGNVDSAKKVVNELRQIRQLPPF